VVQCPACASFNDSGASFCNQCGRALDAPRPASFRRTALLAIGAILLLSLAGVVYLLYDRQQTGGDSKVARGPDEPEPVKQPPAAVLDAPAQPSEASGATGPSIEAIQRQAEGALVRIGLLDSKGQSLRTIAGIVLEGGNILCRFRPLLGAESGKYSMGFPGGPLGGAPAGRSAGSGDIAGLVGYDPFRDLALLEVSGAGSLQGVAALSSEEVAALVPGSSVVALAPRAALASQIGENPYFTLDGVAHARLGPEPVLPEGTLAAFDVSGALIGLCAPEGGKTDAEAPSPRILVDPLLALEGDIGKRAALSLSDATRRFFEGTFADLVAKGRQAVDERRDAQAIDFIVQALDRTEQEVVAEGDLQGALALLRRAVDRTIERQRRERDLGGAGGTLSVAVQRFPEERRYWMDLALVRLDLEDLSGAVAALIQARQIESGADVDALLQKAYLAGAAREVSLGRLHVAAEWLEKGLQILPGSARLHLELAKLYQRWELFDDAVHVYGIARGLDPGLGSEIDAAIDKIQDALSRREALIIPIPQGATTIQTDALINGQTSFRFIIDTGATYTSISQSMADALGYRLGPNTETVRVGTASGVETVPVVILDSVNIQGYAVRNLRAIVLPPRSQAELGLLGLNYLDHFRYTVDAGRKEFRLEKR